MSSIDPELSERYAAYHRSVGNRVAHVVGFPLMGLAATGLAEALGGLAATAVLQLAFAASNLAICPVLGAWCTVVVAGLWLLGRALSAWALLGLGLVGLGLPVATHVLLERRWPEDLALLARFERVGHLWFLERGLRRLGLCA